MAKPSKESNRPEIPTPQAIRSRGAKPSISAEDSAGYIWGRIEMKLRKAQVSGPLGVHVPRDKYNDGALALLADDLSRDGWAASAEDYDETGVIVLTDAAGS